MTTDQSPPSIAHDQIFKQLIEAFFREFLELFCPAVAALIDFTRVEFLREEYFTDVPRGLRKELDLVAKVGLKAGGEKFVLVHGEYESSREVDFARRMFRYFCQLFLRYDTEILPIALFSDDARWEIPLPDHFELALPGRTCLRFDYQLIKLKALDYRQFLKSNNPLAYALMAKMDYNEAQRVRLKADFLRLILTSRVDPARESLLVHFVETYLPLEGSEQAEFEQIVGSDQDYEEVEQMITVYEKKGVEKGRHDEALASRQQTLVRLLRRRFGDLPSEWAGTIESTTDIGQLDEWLDRFATAKTLDDLGIGGKS